MHNAISTPPKHLNERRFCHAPIDVIAAAQTAKISPDDNVLFEKHGHQYFDPTFVNRVFYIYECSGHDRHNKQRPPKILAVLLVIELAFSLERGYEITLLNEATNQKQVVNAVPGRLFGYPIFVSTTCSFAAKSKVFIGPYGETSYRRERGLYVKTSNKSSFYSKENCYAETPSGMARLYPEQDWKSDLNG